MICPLCGCRFDAARHRWTRSRAVAPGRAPAYVWSHQRPGSDRACTYKDGGPLPVCTPSVAGGTLVIMSEDAPEQARLAG